MSKVWFYTYDGTKSKSSSLDLEKLLAGDPLLTPANFINLQRDGRYTAHLGQFETGTWEMDKQYMVLKSADKKVTHLQVQEIKKNELVLDVQPENKYESSYHFDGVDNDLPGEDNPFSAENNQWRIKATHKESDAEIAARLRNHFHYWEKYFEWGITTDRQTLDVRSLRGPLKMYGNGFELVPLEDWDAAWKSLFYDMEDCRIAYNKLHYFFTYERIDWAKTDHRFRMFVSAFQQLQRKID